MNYDNRARVLISGLLCFVLGMLLIAAFRASDPVVGTRWQRFIELVITLLGIGLFLMAVVYARKQWRKRQLLRQHYQESAGEKSEVPVTPATFALTQPPTSPA